MQKTLIVLIGIAPACCFIGLTIWIYQFFSHDKSDEATAQRQPRRWNGFVWVVLLTQLVGLVMVIALLTLPAATALHFARRLWSAMVVAFGLCFLFTVSGIVLSYGPELPAGATYLLAVVRKWIYRKTT